MLSRIFVYGCVTLAFLLDVRLADCAHQAPSMPAGVREITYDRTTQTVVFGLQNLGTQEITAFAYSLRVSKPPSAPLIYEETIDLLPLFSIRSLGPLIGYSSATSFRPGETYTVRSHVPQQWGDISGAAMVVEVTALVYTDCAAAGDDTLIQPVFGRRESSGRAAREVVDAIKAIPRDEGFAAGLRSAADSFGAHSRKTGLANSWPGERAARAANFEKTYERLGLVGVDGQVLLHETEANVLLGSCKRKEK